MTDFWITNDYVKGRLARQIPGAHYQPELGWVVDLDAHPHTRAVASALFPEHRKDLHVKETTLDTVRPIDLATGWAGDRPTEALLPHVPDDVRSRLYRFQAVDLGFLAARLRNDGGAYLGWDRGLGKTFGTLVLGTELGAHRALVVANRKAKQNIWIPEPLKWGLPIRFFDIGGDAKQRKRALDEWRWAEDDAAWAVIHPQALSLIDWKAIGPIDFLAYDEAHKLLHGGNNRQSYVPQFYRALKGIESTYRLAVSGSIIVNSLEDMFGANHWILPKRYGRKWKDWNDRFLEYVAGSGHKTLVGVKREALPTLQRELGAFTAVRFKDDELEGLPDVIEQDIHVELGPQQRRVYDEMAAKFATDLPDGSRLRAVNAMTQLLRLRQIASGLSLVDDTVTDSAKADLAVEMVADNLPHATVVFVWHRGMADYLEEKLADIGVSKVYGGMTDKASTAAIQAFQAGETMAFVGTIASVGESVNLNAAADVIFVEASWVPSDMLQSRDRVAGGFRQQGRVRRISVVRIVAKDTVDEFRILPTLASKAEIRRMVFGGRD